MPQVDKQTDPQQKRQVVQNGQRKQQGVKVMQNGHTQQGNQQKVMQNEHTQQRNQQVMQNGHTQQRNQQVMQNGHTQQVKKQVMQNGHTQQGVKVMQNGHTQQVKQSNLTSEDQYKNLCKKMKQKRQNFTRATQELNAAANQLLQKRKKNTEQYFQRTDAKCRDAIPSMMNAGASTRQGVGKVAAFGKGLGKNAAEGVGKLSRNLGGFFRKK